MAPVQRARDPARIRRRVAGANEAAPDLRCHPLVGFGIERVASEEIDLLQLREQPGTGIAAGRPFQLGDRQRLAGRDLIRIEIGASVEMAGNDQDIATNVLPAG